MIITCPYCSQEIEVADSIAIGQHVRCPYCDKKFAFGISPDEDEDTPQQAAEPDASDVPRSYVQRAKELFTRLFVRIPRWGWILVAIAIVIFVILTIFGVLTEFWRTIGCLLLLIPILLLLWVVLQFCYYLHSAAINGLFDSIHDLTGYNPPKWHRILIMIITSIGIPASVGLQLIAEALIVPIRANKPQKSVYAA